MRGWGAKDNDDEVGGGKMFQYDYDDDDDDDDNDDDNVVGWRQGAVQKTSPQGVPRTSATPHFHDHLLLINYLAMMLTVIWVTTKVMKMMMPSFVS